MHYSAILYRNPLKFGILKDHYVFQLSDLISFLYKMVDSIWTWSDIISTIDSYLISSWWQSHKKLPPCKQDITTIHSSRINHIFYMQTYFNHLIPQFHNFSPPWLMTWNVYHMTIIWYEHYNITLPGMVINAVSLQTTTGSSTNTQSG